LDLPELIADLLGEMAIKVLSVALKSIWIGIIWLFNLGTVSYSVLWEKPGKGWRGGLVFSGVLISGFFLWFFFR